MRVLVALVTLSVTTACGSVPDLRFGDADGGTGAETILDATVPTGSDDASGQKTGGDSAPTIGMDSSTSVPPSDDASIDSAPPPPLSDAQPPPPDAPDTCPAHAPTGGSCCMAVVCRPTFLNYCDCPTCESKCTGGQVCCMSNEAKFEQCAASIEACPKG